MRKRYMRLTLILLLASLTPFAAAQLVCSPNNFSLTGDSVATVTVTDANGAHVKFRYAGVDHPPGFIVVIPSSLYPLSERAMARIRRDGDLALTLRRATTTPIPARVLTTAACTR